MAEGKLREDLWYRLNVFPIMLPPLRERGGDIEVLAEHFLRRAQRGATGRRSAGAARRSRALGAHHGWPGNVRELKNLVHRAYILADARDRPRSALPAEVGRAPIAPGRGAAASRRRRRVGDAISVRVGSSVADVEQQLIQATLEHCGGNKQKAADMLGRQPEDAVQSPVGVPGTEEA